MGYTLYDIAHAWAHNLDGYHGYLSQNLSHRHGKLYSYSTVIGQRIDIPGGEPLWLIQSAYFSNSTRTHQSYMKNAMTGGTVVDVSKYGGIYQWEGIESNGGVQGLKRGLERLCVSFVELFYEQLAGIPYSASIKSEDIAAPTYEINTLINTTNCTTWKKLAARKWHLCNRKKAIQLRKLAVALGNGVESIPQLVVSVFGEKEWSRHITLTLPQQKARETRRKKEDPAYHPIDFDNLELFDFKAEAKAIEKRKRKEQARIAKEAEKSVERWLKGETYVLDTYGLPINTRKKLFNGGNVLLRVNEDFMETSKGISVKIDECKRLWALIKRWHANQTEFHRDICHATTNGWIISSYENDIMTAGCHSIAYSEMERIAKQLKFD